MDAEKILLEDLKIGDYVHVVWYDASEMRAPLREHKKPEIMVDEIGVFLGVEGEPKHILVGKFFVRSDRTWHVTRIPTTLIESIFLIAPRRREISTRRYQVKTYDRRRSQRWRGAKNDEVA